MSLTPVFDYRWLDMQVGTMWRLGPVRGWIGTIDDWIGELVVIEKTEGLYPPTHDPLVWIRKYGDVANGRSQMARCAVVGPRCLKRP